MQGWFALSLVKIGRVILEKKKKMWKVYDNNDADDIDNDDGQRTNCDQKSLFEPSAQMSFTDITISFFHRIGSRFLLFTVLSPPLSLSLSLGF